MHAFTVLALVGAAVANPVAQAVTSAISPKASAPAGCSTSHTGTFEISIVNVTTSAKRSTALECTLTDGVLTDAQGRTGYIASNYQFQFDKPAQAGAIYTAGWSICANSTLALGGSAIFYECLSGTFYNLYDESTGAQCSEVYIDVISASGASASSDGQVTAASATASATAAASQLTDGQVTASAVSQISDGQIQATTATPQVVSQISDGQIQATTGTAAVVSQISDGQIQATTGTAAVVTQISDGQIQATTGTTAVVSQISDGQIQASATNGTKPTTASATVVAYTGAAALPSVRAEFFGLAAGLLALAAL